MFVKKIRLKNYRIYDELELSFDRGINILSGDNAQGKTNLLEAVYYCCAGRSHRTTKDKECIYLGLIYESLPMHNVIFLGKDSRGNDRYAAYRSTGEERILGECAGSDKRFSFRLGSEKTSQIHVFESAIDLLSYATLIHLSGGDYHRFDMLSLGGVYARARDDMPYKLPKALNYYLETHPQVNTVYLHLDNDRAGWQASKGIQEILQNKLKVIDNPPPHGKDVNDFLCLRPLD